MPHEVQPDRMGRLRVRAQNDVGLDAQAEAAFGGLVCLNPNGGDVGNVPRCIYPQR